MNPTEKKFEKLERKPKKEIESETPSGLSLNTPPKDKAPSSVTTTNEDKRAANDLHALVMALREQGFHEFVQHLHSPWRIMWTNFLAGVFRGLGILLGMTVVVGLLIWTLTKMIDFPIIGQYFEILILWMESVLPPEVLQQFQSVQESPSVY